MAKKKRTECASCGLELPCKEYEMGPPLDPARDSRVKEIGERAKFWVCDLCYSVGADSFFAYSNADAQQFGRLAQLVCAVGNIILAKLGHASTRSPPPGSADEGGER